MPELLAILESVHPGVDYASHTRLIDDKVLDSFDIQNLIAEIYDKLDVAIPAEEIIPENFNAFPALSALISRLLEE